MTCWADGARVDRYQRGSAARLKVPIGASYSFGRPSARLCPASAVSVAKIRHAMMKIRIARLCRQLCAAILFDRQRLSTLSLAEVDVRVEGASLPALLQLADPARCCYADGWPHVSDTSHTQQTAHVRLLQQWRETLRW
jgi:hypothetical protein